MTIENDMEQHRATDTSEIKIRTDNRIPTWGVVVALGTGALFVASLLIGIVMTQASTNQTMVLVGNDLKEIKADLKAGNVTASASNLKLVQIETKAESNDKRITAVENQIQILRSK